MTNSVVPDQTAPIGAVCTGSALFASILNLSVMLGNYLQQTTSADNIFRCIFFLALLRVKKNSFRNTFRVSFGFDLDQACRSAGPDLGPSCLQWLSVHRCHYDEKLNRN